MRLLAAAVLAFALSACANNQPVTNAVVGGLVIFMAIDYSKEPRPMPYLSDIYDWQGAPRAAPPMAPERKVVEVDCSQPIDFTAGNIRCK